MRRSPVGVICQEPIAGAIEVVHEACGTCPHTADSPFKGSEQPVAAQSCQCAAG
ncbi:Uncharacterised protein [Mycobacteroides abscessus subsp. massiliense]|nr:Uncharacterised protein [Mycobacteroides abscessus subsp. massiliense]